MQIRKVSAVSCQLSGGLNFCFASSGSTENLDHGSASLLTTDNFPIPTARCRA
jgi:hypothetical protein